MKPPELGSVDIVGKVLLTSTRGTLHTAVLYCGPNPEKSFVFLHFLRNSMQSFEYQIAAFVFFLHVCLIVFSCSLGRITSADFAGRPSGQTPLRL